MNKFVLFVICLLICQIKSDLPIHCYQNDIVGKWKAHLSKEKFEGDLRCGHSIPDNEKTSYRANKLEDAASTLTITLENDNTAKAVDDSSKNEYHGKWTMIYDEGFAIEFSELDLFAFSKYEPAGSKYKSVCSETLVGWYSFKVTKKRGCYQAFKATSKQDSDFDNEDVDNDDEKIVDFSKRNYVVTPKEYQSDKNNNGDDVEDEYEDKDLAELGIFAQTSTKNSVKTKQKQKCKSQKCSCGGSDDQESSGSQTSLAQIKTKCPCDQTDDTSSSWSNPQFLEKKKKRFKR